VTVHALQTTYVLCAHPIPSKHIGHPVPPQSLAVSSPFCTPSMQLGVAQRESAPQTLVTQSPKARHFLPTSQGAQFGPPQSTSVSSGPWRWSSQLGDWHFPAVQN